MGQEIYTFWNFKIKSIIILIVILFLMGACNVKQDYLKDIVYDESFYSDDVILPLMVATPDSLIKPMCVTKISILGIGG